MLTTPLTMRPERRSGFGSSIGPKVWMRLFGWCTYWRDAFGARVFLLGASRSGTGVELPIIIGKHVYTK